MRGATMLVRLAALLLLLLSAACLARAGPLQSMQQNLQDVAEPAASDSNVGESWNSNRDNTIKRLHGTIERLRILAREGKAGNYIMFEDLNDGEEETTTEESDVSATSYETTDGTPETTISPYLIIDGMTAGVIAAIVILILIALACAGATLFYFVREKM